MSDNLRILITTGINIGKSIGELNDQIKALEKHPSLQKIKLKIDIDDKFTQSINQFISAVGKMKKISDDQNKVIEETITEYKRLDGTIERVSEKLHANNERTKQTRITHDANKKSIKEEADATRVLADELDNLGKKAKQTVVEKPTGELLGTRETYKNGANTVQFNTDADGYVTGSVKRTQNIEAEEKETKKLTKANQELLKTKAELRKEIVQLAQAETLSKDKLRQLAKEVNGIEDKGSVDKVRQSLNVAKEASQERIRFLQTEYKVSQDQAKQIAKWVSDTDRAQYLAYQEKEKLESHLHRRVLDRLQAEKAAYIEAERRAQKGTRATDPIGTGATKLGSFDTLKGSGVNYEAVKNALSLTEAYKGLEIREVKLNSVTGQWTATIKKNAKENLALKGVIDRVNGSLYEQEKAIRMVSAKNLGLLEQFKIGISRSLVWAGAMSSIYAPLHALQDATAQVIAINTQMTELARVMPDGSNTADMLRESLNIANELGNKITDINKAMIGFAQAGFSEDQIVALTKTSTLMSNISDLSADEAMETLTSAMIQYNIAAEDSITISDQLNIVSNKFPISFKNLALALARSSSVATTFGVDMSTLIGHVTALGSSTRETGRIVGNALEIIYSRIGTMPEAIKAFNELGIKSESQSAALSIEQLASKWDTLSDSQRQHLGIVAAGRDQLARFLAMLNNFQMAQEATAQALNSENSSLKENAIYMESLEARINKLKNSWTELSLAMGDAVITNTLIVSIQLISDLAKGFQGVVENIGLLPIVFGTVGLAAALMSKGFRTTTISILTLGRGFTALGVSATAAKIALRALGASLVVGAALVAIGFVLEKLIGKWAEHTDEVNKSREAQEKSVESLRSSKQEISGLLEEYNKLNEKTGLSTSENQRFLDVQNQLNELMPSLTLYIDAQGQAHLRNANNIAIELEHLDRLQKKQDEILLRDQKKNRDSLFKDIGNEQDNLTEIEDQGKLAGGFFGQFATQKTKDDLSFEIEDQNYAVEKSYQALGDEIYKNTEALLRQKNAYESLTDEDKRYISTLASEQVAVIKNQKSQAEQKTKYNEASKSIENQALALSTLRAELGLLGNSFSAQELSGFKPEQIAAIKQVNDEVKSGNINWISLSTILKNAGINALTVEQAIKKLSVEQTKAGDSTNQLASQGENLEKTLDDTISSVSTLASAYQTLQKGEQLSADTMLDLINKYPQLAKYLNENNGQIKDKGKILEVVANFEREEALRQEQRLLDDVTNTRNALEDKRKLYEDYFKKFEGVIAMETLFNVKQSMFGEEDKAALAAAEDSLAQRKAAVALLSQPIKLGSWGGGSNKPKGDKPSKKEKSPAELAAEAREKAYNAEVDDIEHLAYMQELNANEQIILWKKLSKNHAQYLKENEEAREDYDKQIKDLNKQSVEDSFNASKSFIEERKSLNQMSLDEEYDAWNRVQKKYKKDSKEWIEIEKEKYRVKKDLTQKLIDKAKELSDKEKDLDNDILSKQKEIRDHVSDMASEIIDIYKDVYETQKKILDAELAKYDEIYEVTSNYILTYKTL